MGSRTTLGTLLTTMAVPLLLTLLGTAARGRDTLTPQPASSGQSCVRDPAFMRYHHMTYLRDLRDQVVRRGDRSGLGLAGRFGISGCGDCHIERTTFCERCHGVAGVKLECFSCHRYGRAAERPITRTPGRTNEPPTQTPQRHTTTTQARAATQ